jgi:DNA invertase Pin-like site-specific DNA recombinase
MYRDFCQRHNLTPLTEVFLDRGRSGYHDEHRKKGRLGVLIQHAKEGSFDPGTVIVVEAWDRLGRLRPDRQTELVAELLRTGVDIGVCRLDDVFTEEDFGTHKWTTLAVFIQLAYQESRQKAERVAASWESRRKRAREKGQLMTTRLPAWVERAGGKLRLIPERAAVVQRIFRLAADGYGVTRIAGVLHRDNVPPFGGVVINPGRKRSQFSGKWTRPYISLILNDRRATGEFQPMKAGKPDGSPLPGYFPAVVTEDEFSLARAAQGCRRSGGKPTRQGKHVNVFRGLLIHARDGEGFMLHNKGTTAEPQHILVNAKGNGGRDRCYTFPYPIFEEAILKQLREIKPEDVLPRQDEAPSRVDVLRCRLAQARNDLARFKEDLRAGYSKALVEVLRQAEQREEEIAGELQDELARSVKPAERSWQELPGLVDMIRKAPDPDAVRLKLRSVLIGLVEEARVLIVRRGAHHLCAVQFHFTGGSRRDYLIVYRTAGFRRERSWWGRSLAEVRVPGDFDLRKREHALKLADVLERVELDAGTS